MKITPLIIALVVFGGTMLAVSMLYGAVQVSYAPGGTANSSTFEAFNQTMTDINVTMSDIEAQTTGALNKPWSDWTKYADMAFAFVGAGGVLMKVPGLFITFMSRSFSFLDVIPMWFRIVLGMIIVIIVVMRVVAIFLKSDDI